MKVDIEQLHRVLVEILDYVCDVCEKNDLTYMLVYGTALGAYRHDGFIPWDDDVDIAMPRDDYNRFLEIMQQQTDSNYTIQNEDNEKKYFLSFAKVRKKNTVFIESIAESMYEDNGIYIDIFPLDYVKDPNAFGYKLRQAAIKYIKHALKVRACKALYKQKRSLLAYWAECLISFPIALFPRSKVVKKLASLMEGSGTKDNANYIAQYDDDSIGQVMPYDFYFPVQKHAYEGKDYNIPHNIQEYLRRCYGDTYMQLPPEEKRQTHQPLELVFDTQA